MLSLFSFSGLDLDTGELNIPYADKITHFTFYLIFAILGCLFLRERTRGALKLEKAAILMGFIAVFYGMLIEVLQFTLTTNRMAEFGDVLANTFGAIVGVGLIKWYFSKERPLKWEF
ncbi:VanZ family protein [Flagellimonas sp. S3867]|uniref:VanZ family protein n=1 Tax=Flagellimonas sp. S3867 TaxID=2768063 RepID=UPI001687454B|nr:VanZ family protein [Flagellimonas sp. S3867]